jgi:hypothetical protein
MELRNVRTVNAYRVLCRDLIDHGAFRSACVGSTENGKGVPRRMAGE